MARNWRADQVAGTRASGRQSDRTYFITSAKASKAAAAMVAPSSDRVRSAAVQVCRRYDEALRELADR